MEEVTVREHAPKVMTRLRMVPAFPRRYYGAYIDQDGDLRRCRNNRGNVRIFASRLAAYLAACEDYYTEHGEGSLTAEKEKC